LYRGTRLDAALDLHAEIDLSDRERSFLAASSAQRTNEIDALRRRGRRQVAFLITLAVLLVVASATGVIAIARQRQAAKLARVAVGRQLVQEAGTATGLDVRLLLAVEARRLDDTVEARGALLDLLTQASPVTAFLHTGRASFSAVEMSSDGSLLATGGVDGTVSVWRLPSHDLVGTMALLSDRITTIAFSGDNELAAGDNTGEVARWGLGGGSPLHFQAHASRVIALAYGAGHSLITVGADDLMRAFSVTTGESLWSRSMPPRAVAGTFDAHGSTYAQIRADGTVSIVDIGASTNSVTVAAAAKETVTALALAADDRTLAFGTNSGDVQLVSPDSGTTRDLGRVAAQGVDAGVAGVDALAFTSAGDVVATAGGAIAWLNPADATQSETLQLVGGRVSGLAIDPAGQTAAAVTETGATVLFDLRRQGLGRPLANAGHPVTALSVNNHNVVAAGDGQVVWWDPASSQRRVIPVQGQPVTALATSTDGTLVATVGHDTAFNGNGTVSVSEVPSGKLRFESDWYPGNAFPTAVAMQPGGSFVAIGDGQGGRVRLYDTATGLLVRDLASLSTAIAGLVFAPSGRELFALTADGELVRWNVDGPRLGDPVKLGSAATSLAIAPDGKSVAAATSGGVVVVDLATETSRPPFTSPFGRIDSLAYGQNGSVLATGGSGHVTLWDVAAGRAIGSPLPVEGETVVAFDSVTDELITGSDNGAVVVWQVDPARWTEAACRLAGRTLTLDEWHRYLGNQPFHPACQ
jgi:WD40 repeat protein